MNARPASRLNTVRQRLARAQNEPAPTRLVTTLSAVEALARSLVVHAPNRPTSTAPIRYQQVRAAAPAELVQEVFRLYGAQSPDEHFGASAWGKFELADQCRHLLVHECTYLPPERYTDLIAAAEVVLEGLVEVGGLIRLVA